jgi:cytochrome c biogenesis protein CcdA
MRFIAAFSYFFSIITIIVGIATVLTAPSARTATASIGAALVGVAIIIVGFIAIWLFRRMDRLDTNHKDLK